jgi:hypothetical protein|uniref:Uncharacterized protein n=1 Tax=Daphnia galeata TaxID=27404 RepID=A0A8J2RMC4_9CRUS|nr:unnamed protein product [Daphnia galeata]
MKKNLKDALLKGLIFAKNTKMEQKDDLDLVQSNATYYNCACYLIFTKKEEINCENCLDSLIVEKSELPSEFYAAHITKLRKKGFLVSTLRLTWFLLHHCKGGEYPSEALTITSNLH